MTDSDAEKPIIPDMIDRQRELGDSVARAAFIAMSSQETPTDDAVEMYEKAEVNEPFGDAESYWTVYRMFAARTNLGKLWSLEDIWGHLSKSYDMSHETLDTLQETLTEWGADIEDDAAKNGIKGTFVTYGKSYVFAEIITSMPTQSNSNDSLKSDILYESAPNRTTSTELELSPVLRRVYDDIKIVLGGSPDGVIKQADIKRILLRDEEWLEPEELQKSIDKLVRKGRIYKFRRGGVAYLALEPHETELSPSVELEKEDSNEKETFDSETSVAILRVLCAPGSHYEQKQSLKSLWVSINGVEQISRINEEELSQLKNVCIQLKRMGLVSARGWKTGKARHVYKVGLVSQGVKKEIQTILEGKNPDDYLQQRFFELNE